MNSKLKKILKIAIVLLIIYLFISSLYILVHIDFEKSPQTVGMGFSESNNMVRLFMGLPKTYSTYQGVSPIYLISVAIRFIVAIVLIIVDKKFFSKIK